MKIAANSNQEVSIIGSLKEVQDLGRAFKIGRSFKITRTLQDEIFPVQLDALTYTSVENGKLSMMVEIEDKILHLSGSPKAGEIWGRSILNIFSPTCHAGMHIHFDEYDGLIASHGFSLVIAIE